jgi:hypothetical protein
MTDEEAIISEVRRRSPDLVHVKDPKAYEAFTDGKLLFDISVDGKLLDEFQAQNKGEFERDFVRGSLADVGSTMGRTLYCLYHEHLVYKRRQQNELWELEREHPELFP